mmetsp:Transcript_16049/g.39312  ORF Transcript_16049/g.39312 Transcript_16049/m.39312 type:complete len:82 (+) Transcript_16049:1368-1613(+)
MEMSPRIDMILQQCELIRPFSLSAIVCIRQSLCPVQGGSSSVNRFLSSLSKMTSNEIRFLKMLAENRPDRPELRSYYNSEP